MTADASPADLPIASDANRDARYRTTMRTLLCVGVAIRLVVCLATGPFNRDDHFGVIRWIAEHGALPASNLLQQSYHPPLYYLIALPLHLVTPAGGTGPIHALALVLSCANLWLIYRLFDDPLVRRVAPSRAARAAAFALVATHAQFVRWSSFVSNDPLAFLVGTMLFAGCLHLARRPDRRRVVMLGLTVALGLLTKGTFLLAGAALAPLVWARLRAAGGRATRLTLLFCAIWLVGGSFKYVDNVVRLGRPFVHNLDREPTPPPEHFTIWRGPRTVYDVNVLELVRHPVIRPYEPNSYALTLYATFWYAHLGDSELRGNVSGYDLVGRATYVAAIVPTILFLLGCGVALIGWFRIQWGRPSRVIGASGRFESSTAPTLRRTQTGMSVPLAGDASLRIARRDARSFVLAAALALFLSNLAVVVAAGVKYDRWECFQSRLLLQSAMPMAVLLLAGLHRLRRWAWPRWGTWAVAGLGVLYLLVEFALLARALPVDETLLFESQWQWAAPTDPR